MINYANMVPYQKLGVADPVAVAIDPTGIGWLSVLVKFAALAGLTTVIFKPLDPGPPGYGTSRIMFRTYPGLPTMIWYKSYQR